MKKFNNNLKHNIKSNLPRFAVILAIFVAGVFAVAKLSDVFKTNAQTALGSSVTISRRDGLITYGTIGTYRYYVKNSSNETYLAVCSDPTKASPTGTRTAQIWEYNTGNYAKMLLWAFTSDTTAASDARTRYFGDSSTSDANFAILHGAVGIAAHPGDYWAQGYLTTSTTPTYDQIANAYNAAKADYEDTNSDAYKEALTYEIYWIEGGTDEQDLVWVEPRSTAYIKVQKCDAETQKCKPLNGASFAGITYKLYNASGTTVLYNGETYDAGALLDTKTTDANGTVTFGPLVADENITFSYRVYETASNDSYLLSDTDYQTVPVNTSKSVYNLYFYDQVKRGNLTFKKYDKETNTPLSGVTFTITSDDTGESATLTSDANGVVDVAANGVFFGKDSAGNTAASSSSTAANPLPYGTYTITENNCSSANNCKVVLTSIAQSARVSVSGDSIKVNVAADNITLNAGFWYNSTTYSLGTTLTDSDSGKYKILNNDDLTLTDTAAYCLKANKSYRIVGTLMDKSTGEPFKLNGETITAEKAFTSAASGCGDVALDFDLDLNGFNETVDLVAFEKVYDADNNEVVTHEDLEDADQTFTLYDPSLSTTLTEKGSEEKNILVSAETTLTDTVTYCAKPNETYIITGHLVNQASGATILVNNAPITASTVVELGDEGCSTATLDFTFDTTAFADSDIVAFESLYLATLAADSDPEDPTYDTTLLVAHEDINDAAQTVHLYAETPETGHTTVDTNTLKTDHKTLLVLAISALNVGLIILVVRKVRR